jgi:hypothetical protein
LAHRIGNHARCQRTSGRLPAAQKLRDLCRRKRVQRRSSEARSDEKTPSWHWSSCGGVGPWLTGRAWRDP